MSATKKWSETEELLSAQTHSLLNSIPRPVLVVDEEGLVVYVNAAAEQFFAAGASWLTRQKIDTLVPFGSPLLVLIAQARDDDAPVSEYGVDVGTPRIGEKFVDIQASPIPEQPGAVLILLQERSIAQKMDRQLTHRGATRSMNGMAAVLAHEIKNPLSGIRGAAQLLEQNANPDDRTLTKLICEEVDRIRKLVDRMEVFSDNRPVDREAVNIHQVLGRVHQLAEKGFAQNLTFVEEYDPSLPPVLGDRDQLIQVFLNLVKNAAEAVDPKEGEITLTTAYRPGVRLSVPGSRERVSLPLEVCVRDNGSGVSEDLMPHLFEPFVTSKTSGTGLGLALVAKIVGDHGGIVECESLERGTVFRVLLPMQTGSSHHKLQAEKA